MKLSELEALAEKATKGPWTAVCKNKMALVKSDSESVQIFSPNIDHGDMPLSVPRWHADAQLIAYLSNHRHEIINLVKAAKKIESLLETGGFFQEKSPAFYIMRNAIAAFEEK